MLNSNWIYHYKLRIQQISKKPFFSSFLWKGLEAMTLQQQWIWIYPHPDLGFYIPFLIKQNQDSLDRQPIPDLEQRK